MKKLNLEEFTVDPEYKTSFSRKRQIKGDTVRKLTDFNDRYQVRERINNSAFSTVRVYFKPSLNLSAEVTKFYDLSMVTKSYDEYGNLTSTKNFEKEQGFSFTVEMLIEKLKKEYNIDLEFPNHNPNAVEVVRGGGIYTVRISPAEYWIPWTPPRAVKIDGKTGKVISDGIEKSEEVDRRPELE